MAPPGSAEASSCSIRWPSSIFCRAGTMVAGQLPPSSPCFLLLYGPFPALKTALGVAVCHSRVLPIEVGLKMGIWQHDTLPLRARVGCAGASIPAFEGS